MIGRRTEKAKNRLTILDSIVEKLYEDVLSNRISQDTFDKLMAKTRQEQETLKSRMAEDEDRMSDDTRIIDETTQWLDVIREYADIKELDAATLNRLVRRYSSTKRSTKTRKDIFQ